MLGDDDDDTIDYGGYGWVVQAVTKRVLLKKSNGPLSLTESMIIDSCLARGDEETAKQHIQDWNATRAKTSQSRDVSKWVPGDHFYALDQKFITLDDAIDHIERNGYIFGVVRERFQYRENGG